MTPDNNHNFIDRIIALHGLTLELAEQNTERDLFRLAVERTLADLDLDRFAVFLVDDAQDWMRGTWGTDSDGRLVDESDFHAPLAERAINARTLAQHGLVTVDEPATLYWRNEPVGTGWNAMVAMWQGDQALGWLSADNLIQGRPFTEEDREVLKLLAGSIGQMIQRVRAEASLRRLNRDLEARVAARTRDLEAANRQLIALARTDPLTGLANRREFERALRREWHRARRQGSRLSLAMLDVDHFKLYNDRLGHPAGDACLKVLADLLGECAQRGTDLAARLGGEEFVLLLPDTGREEAEGLVRRLRDRLRDAGLGHPDSPLGDNVTLSAGLVTRIPSGDPEAMLAQADAALYRAKAGGRDCLVVEAEEAGSAGR